MDLYILRHGIAEPRGGSKPDPERALTDDGRRKLRLVLERARAAKVAPSLILSSPYVRAMQTAEIAAGVLKYRGEIVQTKALLPNARVERLWAEIRSHGDERAILVAGHEPHLSRAVAYLLGVPELRLNLKKGALVHIAFESPDEQPHGVLSWILTPKLAA
jgi:phosphohistidine phosphatase